MLAYFALRLRVLVNPAERQELSVALAEAVYLAARTCSAPPLQTDVHPAQRQDVSVGLQLVGCRVVLA